MNKIWTVVGIVGLIVFILFAWLFIFEFQDFSNILGEKAEKITENEDLTIGEKLEGTWDGNLDVSNQYYNKENVFITKLVFKENKNLTIHITINNIPRPYDGKYSTPDDNIINFSYENNYLVFCYILENDILNINNALFYKNNIKLGVQT